MNELIRMAMMDELKDFMSKLFTAQEVERKKEHKEFKEDIQIMMKEGIKSEVEAATKPVRENQEKIMKEHETLMKKVGELEKKVEEIDKKGDRGSDFPALQQPERTMQSVSERRDHEVRDETAPTDKDKGEVKKLFKRSNLTLGLSPISEEYMLSEVNKLVEETGEDRELVKAKVMKECVKEFLVMEMKVKEEHVEKLDIVRIFAPQKSKWNIVYMELESQDQIDWVMSHAKWIPEVEKGKVQTKVVKYVPRQLYNRWNALQKKAFDIRKDSNWTTQTKIGHGETDFFLQTRQKGERAWSSDLVLPSDLPKVELEFIRREDRSPKAAPGRERYKDNQRHDKRKERPSSGSSVSNSPPQKQANVQNSEAHMEDEGLLARPDLSRVVESSHPPGSPGHGINNPHMFNHLDAAFVSSRKK